MRKAYTATSTVSAQLPTSSDTTITSIPSSFTTTALELSKAQLVSDNNKFENIDDMTNNVDRNDSDLEDDENEDGEYIDGIASFDDDDDAEDGIDDETTVSNGDENHVLQEEYSSWLKAVDKQLLVLDRKRTALQNELQRVQQLQQLQSRANLITSNMYLFTSNPTQRTVLVQDWSMELDDDNNDSASDSRIIELTLNPKYSTASEEAAALYDEAKKMKRGSKVLQPLIDSTVIAYDTLYDIQQQLTKVVVPEVSDDNNNSNIDIDTFRYIQEQLCRTSKATNFNPPDSGRIQQKKQLGGPTKKNINNSKKPDLGTPASNVRKIISPSGTIIYVGRNRRGNEYLSLNIARNNDLWMHARGVPGAHVVIKQQKRNNNSKRRNTNKNEYDNGQQQEQDDNFGEDYDTTRDMESENDENDIDECVQLGANLAAFYSDGRTERKVSISVAEPKHILKPRNAPLGAIKLREELFVCTGYPENVPYELKIARDEAGQISTDFFRSTDKSKLRKRNKELIQKEKSKKKKLSQQKKKQQQEDR
jgi:predicted ribosome quality control (RQC) complex YloA/Tae2 family protein